MVTGWSMSWILPLHQKYRYLATERISTEPVKCHPNLHFYFQVSRLFSRLSSRLFSWFFSRLFSRLFGDVVCGLNEIVQMSKNVVEGDSNKRSCYYCSFSIVCVVCTFPVRSSNNQLSLDFMLPWTPRICWIKKICGVVTESLSMENNVCRVIRWWMLQLAAFGLYPLTEQYKFRLLVTNNFCILTLGDNHRFGSISEIELRPDNKTTLFSVISVIRFYLRTSTGQQLGKNCHRKIKMRGSIWFDFDWNESIQSQGG